MTNEEMMRETLEHIALYGGDVYVRKLCRSALMLADNADADARERLAAAAPRLRAILMSGPQPK